MAEASPQPGRYFCHCCSAEIAPRLPVRDLDGQETAREEGGRSGREGKGAGRGRGWGEEGLARKRVANDVTKGLRGTPYRGRKGGELCLRFHARARCLLAYCIFILSFLWGAPFLSSQQPCEAGGAGGGWGCEPPPHFIPCCRLLKTVDCC